MKYIKYLFIGIAVLALIFFGMGIAFPSVDYECEVSIDKPVEETWAIVSDSSRISEWLKEVKRIEHKSGTAHTVGAVSKIYVEENGEEMMMEETVNAVIPNEYLAMRFTMDFMDMNYEMRFAEKDGKTKVTTKSKSIGNSFFAKFMLAVMSKSMLSQEEKNLTQLKEVVEKNTKNYFPISNLDATKDINEQR